MTKGRIIRLTLAACLVIMTAALAAQAQANRTFIRSNGTDAGTCPVTTPCLTLTFAHSVTNAGGEIVVMDSYGVGQLTITKAITIVSAPGVIAFIKAQPATVGITVSAGASDIVVLRNLAIGAQNGASTTGVFHAGGKLTIENCTFTLLTTAGVTAAGGAASTVDISRSVFVGNGKGVLAQSGVVNLEGNTFTQNTVAIRAEGQGLDLDPATNGTAARLTMVRVSNGMITNNGTAYDSFNAGVAGTRQGGSCNANNIYIRDLSGQGNGQPNTAGNTLLFAFSGSFDNNAGCGGTNQIGSYSSQQQNPNPAGPNPANNN
ncbi:MAG TPA: hypothetical protein VJS64_02355 [Pyrinomonadaceae bacterium]|nr:hypothetical protein [Pyrinomonadaceae bacterium]